MDELKLPEQLTGPWQHALILTYGVDMPFFENVLWRQFSSRCRNKIILADGDQLLAAYEQYAATGLVRYMNQQYIAEGIFSPRAAHAKAILLTNPERGRLLVGSGNLNQGGYASGGELFTMYEYTDKNREVLSAFLSIRELIEALVRHGYIQGPARKRIERLFAETPWFYQAPVSTTRPVRHNLDQSFIDQLEESLAGESVEELWIMSPFYDAECKALGQLLSRLKPRQATLLVQPGRTSVASAALRSVLHDTSTRCEVRTIRRNTDSTYLHAKCYLVKTATRAVCLQGSPNLSQVAMLLPHPHGNIEVANLLEGEPEAFDYILDQLDLGAAVVELDELELSYVGSDGDQDAIASGPRLLGGEWKDDRLVLRFRGELPPVQSLQLAIAGHTHAINVRRKGVGFIELALEDEVRQLLTRTVPVQLTWEGEQVRATNPVFVCNEAALNAVIEAEDAPEVLPRLGDLDLDDDEIERLLGELDAALVIDRQSVWQLAGRTMPSSGADDNEALRLDYAEVDYDLLRRHPRIQQYFRQHNISAGGYTRTRLQIILHTITDHFRGLLEPAAVGQVFTGLDNRLSESEIESEQEAEEAEAVRVQRRRSVQQRVRRLLINFINRYLRGIRSSDFQELAGHEVMAQNYVIFSHFLWRLFSREWVEHPLVGQYLLEMWQLFWGSLENAGYWSSLDPEQQEQTHALLQKHHAAAYYLASLYYSVVLTRATEHSELRFALRDQWRYILTHQSFSIDEDALEYAWHLVAGLDLYDPPRPSKIVEGLVGLAFFETRAHFLRSLERASGQRDHSYRIERMRVFRESTGNESVVECLVLPHTSLLSSQAKAIHLFGIWMRAEPDLGYYRIHTPNAEQIAFYDSLNSSGIYWDKATSDHEVTLEQINATAQEWDSSLAQLIEHGRSLDNKLAFAVTTPLPLQSGRTTQDSMGS